MTKLAPKTLAKRIVKIAWSKKAENIVLLDLKKISSMTDYFLVCSAGSDVQARVIAEAIIESLEDSGIKCSVEGLGASHWILIDCYCVVVHIFLPEVREFYGLERLWGDAKREEFSDDE
ncbi:MAG: ribosome silencing factor [Candidatus Krumholzibacteria bacterium]|nr:ribosome silencing factor [Candidatus Krumholzibacteria bacterium]